MKWYWIVGIVLLLFLVVFFWMASRGGIMVIGAQQEEIDRLREESEYDKLVDGEPGEGYLANR